MTPLLAGHRQARQPLPRPLPRLGLVPARHLPRDHARVTQRALRTVVRRFRRGVVQAAQDHPTPFADPLLNRHVPRLAPLLGQQPVQPRLQVAPLPRELLFAERHAVFPQRIDHREQQLPLVQIAWVGRVRPVPRRRDRLLVVGNALVHPVRQVLITGQAVAHQDAGEVRAEHLQHHLPAAALVDVVDRRVGGRERPQPVPRCPDVPARLVDEHGGRAADLGDQAVEGRGDLRRGALHAQRQSAGAEREAAQELQHAAGLACRQPELLVQRGGQGTGAGAQLNLGRAGGGRGLQRVGTVHRPAGGTAAAVRDQAGDAGPDRGDLLDELLDRFDRGDRAPQWGQPVSGTSACSSTWSGMARRAPGWPSGRPGGFREPSGTFRESRRRNGAAWRAAARVCSSSCCWSRWFWSRRSPMVCSRVATWARSVWFSCRSCSRVARSVAVMVHPTGRIGPMIDSGQQKGGR